MGLTQLAATLALTATTVVGAGPDSATAQNGSVVGKVTDSRGAPVGGVEVTIGAISARARTTDSGTFKLSAPSGTYRISFRRLGYTPVVDSVAIADDEVTDRRFVLTHTVVSLDPVTVAKPLSVNMRRFEDRRHTQQGAFIDWSQIEKDQSRPLRSLLARKLPGILFVGYRGALYAASVRGNTQMDRRTRIRAVIADPRSPTACFLQVFLDGTRIYAPDGSSDAVDLNDFQTKDFQAVEYYAGSVNTPPEFSSSWSACGTLVFWTRLP